LPFTVGTTQCCERAGSGPGLGGGMGVVVALHVNVGMLHEGEVRVY
jgi:hypothetical protein